MCVCVCVCVSVCVCVCVCVCVFSCVGVQGPELIPAKFSKLAKIGFGYKIKAIWLVFVLETSK